MTGSRQSFQICSHKCLKDINIQESLGNVTGKYLCIPIETSNSITVFPGRIMFADKKVASSLKFLRLRKPCR